MGVARSSDTRCFGHGGRKKLAERLAKAGRVDSAQLIIGIGLGGVRATESIRLPRVTRRRRRGEGEGRKVDTSADVLKSSSLGISDGGIG